MPMAIRLTAKEINVRKVKTLLRDVKANKIDKANAAKELNRRFERMKKEDEPWFEDLHPKYISLFRI